MKVKKVLGYTLIVALLVLILFGIPCMVGLPWWSGFMLIGMIVAVLGIARLIVMLIYD